MSYSQAETQQRFIGIARQAAEDLLAERGDVLSIYVYGSVGRGDATPESDIDLHVVIDGTERPKHEITLFTALFQGYTMPKRDQRVMEVRTNLLGLICLFIL